MPVATRAALHLLLAGLLAACAPLAPGPARAPSTEARPDFREAHYRRAEALGQTVFRVDPQRSLLAITVRRGGSLARLGHEHAVASHMIEGFVAPEQGRADLHFRLDQLTLDEPALRAEAALDTQPSADAIDGTRRNMLDKVLDAARFPYVLIHATRAAAGNMLGVSISLHGVTREMEIPVQFEAIDGPAGAAGMAVSGVANLLQSDFGIAPFSVLGGAIAVQDRLELRFRIVAQALH